MKVGRGGKGELTSTDNVRWVHYFVLLGYKQSWNTSFVCSCVCVCVYTCCVVCVCRCGCLSMWPRGCVLCSYTDARMGTKHVVPGARINLACQDGTLSLPAIDPRCPAQDSRNHADFLFIQPLVEVTHVVGDVLGARVPLLEELLVPARRTRMQSPRVCVRTYTMRWDGGSCEPAEHACRARTLRRNQPPLR